MGERYSDRVANDADAPVLALLARLVPDADAGLLLAGLRDEAAGAAPAGPPSPAARELDRLRQRLALGSRAALVQHTLNNPLTALLAEAQLLQLEPLADDHKRAVTRLVELARRMAAVVRSLDVPGAPRGSGGRAGS